MEQACDTTANQSGFAGIPVDTISEPTCRPLDTGNKGKGLDVGSLALVEPEVGDTRFRDLIGAHAWAQLPVPVRRRFCKKLIKGDAAIYSGMVTETRLSVAGRILAWLGRIIGTPLPETDGAVGEAVVTVIEDETLGGQIWTRSYARPGRFPQVVHSAKRFRGPTGLEEYVGTGVGMTLQVAVEDRALVFRSHSYFLEWGRWRVALPRALSPGNMTIIHRQEADGQFSFTLTLTHQIFGEMIRQLAYFRDV